MLFESYFNQVSQLSDEIQKMIEDALDASKYTTTKQGLEIKINHPKYPLTIKLNMLPDPTDAAMFALMRNYSTTTRFTIELKNGKKRRRILPTPGGVLSVNVANLVADSRKDIPFYSDLKPYLHKIDTDVFEFINLNIDDFVHVCSALMSTSRFKGIISHEIQHNYNPLIHRKIIPNPKYSKKQQSEIRKVASTIVPNGKIPKSTLVYTKYAINNDEVNSSVAEAIASVRHYNIDGDMFRSSSPKEFVNECIAYLKKVKRWSYYTDDVKRKVLRRLSQTFYDLRQPSKV